MIEGADSNDVARNVGLLVNLATTGGFGALVWYLITRAIPAQNREARQDAASARVEHLAETKQARSDFVAALRENEDSHRSEIAELRAVTMQMVDLVQRARAKD